MNQEKKINSLDVAQKQVDTAAKYLRLNPGLIEKVRRFILIISYHQCARLQLT